MAREKSEAPSGKPSSGPGISLQPRRNAAVGYWDAMAEEYFSRTHISVQDFHYGPLLPGDRILRLLPSELTGKRCLELGCGGAQNSLVLARRGAACTAIDPSPAMLAHARRLAARHRQDITFRQSDMRHLPADLCNPFDLIHSVFAMSFVPAPEPVLADIAARLKPGGLVLISAPHPLWAGEWVQLAEEHQGDGLFLPDAFRLTDDTRQDAYGRIRSRHWPLSRWFAAFANAGLAMERLLEPAPLPPSRLRRAPYWSEEWIEQHPQLCRIPVAVIFLARRKP
jgi:SAM-dependent methyltransferase